VKRQKWTEFGLPRKRLGGGVIGRIKPYVGPACGRDGAPHSGRPSVLGC
jgi:hypothetical protein